VTHVTGRLDTRVSDSNQEGLQRSARCRRVWCPFEQIVDLSSTLDGSLDSGMVALVRHSRLLTSTRLPSGSLK
jgi:hypothetical protein